jgi:hypothetical protein
MAAPIEAAMEGLRHQSGESPWLRAALADAAEDDAEARFIENPCEKTARDLIRRRTADHLAALEHDREIAARYNISL